jgi:hypothetical protein
MFPSLGENTRKHVTISVGQKEQIAITVQHMSVISSVCAPRVGDCQRGDGAGYSNNCEGPEEGRSVSGNKYEINVSLKKGKKNPFSRHECV